MAWLIWPDLSDPKIGPCPEPCQHRDCAEMRSPDYAKCNRCGQDLKAGERFYFEDRHPAHASEVEAALEGAS